MHRFLVFSGIFFLIMQSPAAQVGVGQWRDHLPYGQAHAVEEAGDLVYCATAFSMFTFNRKDQTVTRISKVNGLSDLDICCLRYSQAKNTLLVGYRNGNVDLITGKTITNIADIKRYTQIMGNKQINHALFVNNLVYLSCGFGIVVLDPEKKEIRDTYYIADGGAVTEVFQMAFDGTNLYAATEKGILTAPLDHPNLAHYAAWKPLAAIPSYLKTFRFITWHGGRMYGVHSRPQDGADSLFALNGLTWDFIESGGKCQELRTSGNRMVLSYDREVRVLKTDGSPERIISESIFPGLSPGDAIAGETGLLWIADHSNGLLREVQNNVFKAMAPNGPYTSDVLHITASGGEVYVAGGGRDATYNNLFKTGLVYHFSQEHWTSIIDYTIRDVVRILVVPGNPAHFFAATWGYGVLEYLEGKLVNHYHAGNSSLQSIIPGGDFVRIGGIARDADGNLWMTNTGVQKPVSVKTQSEWIGIPYNIDAPTLGDIIVTGSGHKWILLPRGYGLFAFDDNGTPALPGDDRSRKFGLADENGKTITNDVYAIAEDKEGNIWVGTNQGPLVYYSPEQVFSGNNFYAQQVKIPSETEGQANYLLGTETITAIAVDGGNRKWFGTASSGVYLFSADGQQEIHHFTADNSPLLSDNILTIAIDGKSGEVFFGTDKGIISYRSTATEGGDTFRNVYVYPNPVREDYNGPIMITGLVRDASVKITDISGNLVFETTSVGGQAEWDGKNPGGEEVATGVYLVFCSNKDGSSTYVTKFLYIR